MNNMYGVIYKTYEYDKFKFITGNRNVNKVNESKILNSMKQEQLVIPIVVNEKYEIIDGQHRYSASKTLGLPIYYFVQQGYGIEQVKRANISSSNWKKEDYLNMHILDGKESYIEFYDLMKRYGMSLGNLLKVFSIVQEKQQPRVAHEFEEGEFEIEGKDKVVLFLSALEDFSFFKYYKTTPFVIAFLKMFFLENYNHDKMLNKLNKNRSALEKRSTFDEYLVLLCNKIYSYGHKGHKSDAIYYSSESKKFHQ